MSAAGSIRPHIKMNDFARIPSVEQILQQAESIDLIALYGRVLVVEEIQNTLANIRNAIPAGTPVPDTSAIIRDVKRGLEDLDSMSLLPVINATGVVLHTNLGRAPLSRKALQAILHASASYSTVELDLIKGKRQNRNTRLEKLLQRLLKVESALVVNNNAAGVFLTLRTLGFRRKVIISRNQLVEIGGGFRIPDILQQTGARLMEVGTTNQIRLDDYRRAIREGGSIILHVHPANFKITGYTSEPELKDIVELAHKHDLPVIDDLGSGAMLDTSKYGMGHEPTVQESLAAGTDVVCFSCDKLLGGPQGGIILGKEKYLTRIKKHPLARILRTDKTLIAALEATLIHYLNERAEQEIPVWQMISLPVNELKNRVEHWKQQITNGVIMEGHSTVGGGSLPEETLPTYILALPVKKADSLTDLLRNGETAVFPRIQDGMVCFDPRTVLPDQDDLLVQMIKKALLQYREKYEN